MKLTGDRNQCQGCKSHFNSTFAFDKHRSGAHGAGRHCISEAEMLDKGMSKNAAGFWISCSMPNDFSRSTPMCEAEEAYIAANTPRWGS